MREKRLHIENGNLISRQMLFAYIRNDVSTAEKLRIEKQIQQDPFLSDAVDGLKNADLQTVNRTLDRIYRDIDILTGEKKPFTITRTVKMYAAAASMILFLGLTFIIMDRLNDQQQAGEIAMEPASESSEINADTSISSDMGGGGFALTDSTEVVLNDTYGNTDTREKTNVTVENKLDDQIENYSTESTIYDDKNLQDELAITEAKIAAEQIYVTPGVLNEEISMADFDKEAEQPAAPFTTSNVATTNDSFGIAGDNNLDDSKTLSEVSKKSKSKKDVSEVVPASSERAEVELFKQEDNQEYSTSVFSKPEVSPEFPGGEDSLKNYLTANIIYPVSDYKVDGKVVVQFIINEDGSVSDAVIKNGIGPAYDIEALRVVMQMPKWKPGMINGKAVKVQQTLSIKFKAG